MDIYTIDNITRLEIGETPIARGYELTRPFRHNIRGSNRFDDFAMSSKNNATASYYRAYPNCNYNTAKKNSKKLLNKFYINFEIYMMRLFEFMSESNDTFGIEYYYNTPITYDNNRIVLDELILEFNWYHYFETHNFKFKAHVKRIVKKLNDDRLEYNKPILKKIDQAKARGEDTQELEKKLFRYKKPYTEREIGAQVIKQQIEIHFKNDIVRFTRNGKNMIRINRPCKRYIVDININK